MKNSVVQKLGAFCLKISTFTCLLVVAIHVTDLVVFTMVFGWHVTSET